MNGLESQAMKKSDFKRLLKNLSTEDKSWLDSKIDPNIIDNILSSEDRTNRFSDINQVLEVSADANLKFSTHVQSLILKEVNDD